MSFDGHTALYRVHPAPPPTVNSLTSRQKAQLRRSTNKLTKVLGAAPQVLDDGYGSLHVSRPLPLAAAKKKQPSLSVSVESGKGKHRRTKSAEAHVDPDLYPLSSSLRPAKPQVRKSAPAAPSSHYQLRRERSKSVAGSQPFPGAESSFDPLVNALSALHQRRARPYSGATAPTDARAPTPQQSRPDSLATHDSLYDSLYEPAFVIPSSTKLRRDKMARVCKLLGEEVPIELVFPSPAPRDCASVSANKYDLDDSWSVLDIRRESIDASIDPPTYADSEAEKLLPPLPSFAASAPLPKPKLSINTNTDVKMTSQPRWSSYRATARTLEPIAELSPRSSSSSRASYASGISFSSNTTSSSYRFTSSGCSDPIISPADALVESMNVDRNVAVASPTQDVQESYGFQGRREFSIYVPFHRRKASAGYAPVLGSDDAQEVEVVKAMVNLRV